MTHNDAVARNTGILSGTDNYFQTGTHWYHNLLVILFVQVGTCTK